MSSCQGWRAWDESQEGYRKSLGKSPGGGKSLEPRKRRARLSPPGTGPVLLGYLLPSTDSSSFPAPESIRAAHQQTRRWGLWNGWEKEALFSLLEAGDNEELWGLTEVSTQPEEREAMQ